MMEEEDYHHHTATMSARSVLEDTAAAASAGVGGSESNMSSSAPTTPRHHHHPTLKDWIRSANLSGTDSLQAVQDTLLLSSNDTDNLMTNMERIYTSHQRVLMTNVSNAESAMQLRAAIFNEVIQIRTFHNKVDADKKFKDAIDETLKFLRTYVDMCHVFDPCGYCTPTAHDLETNSWDSRFFPVEYEKSQGGATGAASGSSTTGNGSRSAEPRIVPRTSEDDNPLLEFNVKGFSLYLPDIIFEDNRDPIFITLLRSLGAVATQIMTLDRLFEKYTVLYDDRNRWLAEVALRRQQGEDEDDEGQPQRPLGLGSTIPRLGATLREACKARLVTLMKIYNRALSNPPPYLVEHMKRKAEQQYYRQQQQMMSMRQQQAMWSHPQQTTAGMSMHPSPTVTPPRTDQGAVVPTTTPSSSYPAQQQQQQRSMEAPPGIQRQHQQQWAQHPPSSMTMMSPTHEQSGGGFFSFLGFGASRQQQPAPHPPQHRQPVPIGQGSVHRAEEESTVDGSTESATAASTEPAARKNTRGRRAGSGRKRTKQQVSTDDGGAGPAAHDSADQRQEEDGGEETTE